MFFSYIRYMTVVDRSLVKAYVDMLEGLSAERKIELIERLSETLKKDAKAKEKRFFKSFGAFGSAKPAKEIVSEMRAVRKFRKRYILV